MLFLEREEPHEVFSFEELRKYVGNAQRHEYLQKTLGEAQYGSSRAVYNLSQNSVLKVALNDKGMVQNKTEYELFHSAPPTVKEILAAIEEPHDTEFEWIVMEKVKPLDDEASFEQALGLTSEMASELFSSFCFYSKDVEDLKANIQKSIDYFTELPSNKPRKWDKIPKIDPRIAKYKQALHFTDDFARLCLAVPHLETNGGDLGRLDQLGMNRNGRLVILDYGFGENAFKMYNPSIYQQADAQRRQEMDLDYYEYDGNEQYDKYGNKIAKPKPRTNTMPSKKPQANKPFADDEDIPF